MRSVPLHPLPPVVPPCPREEIPVRLAVLRVMLRSHMEEMPNWRDFNLRQAWAMDKEHLERDITLLENQQEPIYLTA